jgi:type IV secretion system protein VirB9
MTARFKPFPAVVLACLAASLAACPARAETSPRSGRHDVRVTHAAFQEGQVYRISTRLRTVTLVQLGDGENIRSIAIGDLESFRIDKLERPNLFIIKPVVEGATTNLTVETDRNIYFLQVAERADGNPTYSVKFTLPGASRGTPQGAVIPPALPMSYTLMKKGRKLPDFAPVSISDDGRKTTFTIPPGAPMPTIFRADAKGREYSVNSAVRGTTITVTARSEHWVLRYGDAYVCVTAETGRGR